MRKTDFGVWMLVLPIAACGGDPAGMDPNDRDGDGLSNAREEEGWEIVVDELGYGLTAGAEFLVRKTVTSDPDVADTDGDGLDDGIELAERTDPRRVDTDGDGLTDREERDVYRSNLLSADSDGDALDPSGNTVPVAGLFDGAEIRDGTSPTLADTDGDGMNDREERDRSNRDPRVAEIPQIDMQAAGELDLRLFVTYADSQESEVTYGQETIRTKSRGSSRTDTESTAVTHAASSGGQGFFDDLEFSKAGALKFFGGKALELGRSAACGSAAEGGQVKFDKSEPNVFKSTLGLLSSGAGAVLNATGLADTDLCAEPTPETTNTTSVTLTEESSSSLTRSSSEYRREAQIRTETAARGVVNLSFTFANTGLSTVELVAPSITMMQWVASPDPGAALGSGTFRTVGTLRPPVGADGQPPAPVLSPSGAGSTVTLEMSNDQLNPALVKDLLARPGALFFSPGQFELNDRDGVAYDFLVEETYGRTGTLVIDDGREDIRRFQVATNVERTDAGDFSGARLGVLLRDVLGIPFTTRAVPRRNATGEVVMTEELHSLDGERTTYANDRPENQGDPQQGIVGDPQAYWIVYVKRESEARSDLPFEDVRLYAGDEIRLVYVRDQDGDGLYEREERMYGTDDNQADSDGDGLTDFQEVKMGWPVTIAYLDGAQRDTVSYRVASNPQLADADGDLLTDEQERMLGTDPSNADTDDDGISDRCEVSPTDAERTTENGACVPIEQNRPAALYITDGNQVRMVRVGQEGLRSVRVVDDSVFGERHELALSPDRKHLMVAAGRSSDDFIAVFDVDAMTDELLPSPYVQPAQTRGLANDRSVIIDPRGRYVWSMDRNGDRDFEGVYTFDLNRDRAPGRLENPRRTNGVVMQALFIHPNGSFVYGIDDDDRRLTKLTVERDQPRVPLAPSTDQSLPTRVTDVAMSVDGRRLYAVSSDGHLYTYEVDIALGDLRQVGRVVDTGPNAQKVTVSRDRVLVLCDAPDRSAQGVLLAYRDQGQGPVAVDQDPTDPDHDGFGSGFREMRFDETGTYLFALGVDAVQEVTLSADIILTGTGRTASVGGEHLVVLNRVR